MPVPPPPSRCHNLSPTDDEVAAKFAAYLGRPMPYRRLNPAEIPKAADPPPAEGSSKNLVFKVDVEEIRKIHPNYVTLEQWLATEWNGKDHGAQKAKM